MYCLTFAKTKPAYMKKISLLTLTVLCATMIFGQKKQNIKFSVGAELAFTSGNFSNSHSFGIGGTGQLEIPLQDKLNGIAYGGIMLYNGKSDGAGKKIQGVTIIPLRIGVKYFLTGSVYTNLQAGLGFISGPDEFEGSAFSYSPQIGYEFQTNTGKNIDATFKYDAYAKSGGSLGSFGLRIAYIF